MTFTDFMKLYKAEDGTQKGFGLSIGITDEAQISRILNKKQRVGLKMLNRMLAACGGKVSMGELCKEFRPDIYEAIMESSRKSCQI